MKRRLRRWGDLRADIAARDRISLAVVDPPLLQRDDVDLFEGTEALLGEWRRRAQLAGAERRERPAGLGDDPFDPLKAMLQWNRRAEAHATDCMARHRRCPAGILEHGGNEAISSGGEIGCHG